jgi:hypothetical protein
MKYIHFVIRSIDALKFILDWNAKSHERGGKKWKSDYRDRLFEEQMASEIERHRNELEADEFRHRIQRLRQKFVRKHERTITARNHLLKLYNTVSF